MGEFGLRLRLMGGAIPHLDCRFRQKFLPGAYSTLALERMQKKLAAAATGDILSPPGKTPGRFHAASHGLKDRVSKNPKREGGLPCVWFIEDGCLCFAA
jgi:hypothetical protein